MGSSTVGSVDVNIETIGNIVNNSTFLGAEVTQGVADQGALIGLAIGLLIALGLLIVVILKILTLIPTLMSKIKRIS